MSKPRPSAVTRWLESASPTLFSTYAIFAAFTTYFCMYAFRRPFTAATYDDLTFGEVELKTALVISQILGYALSKFIGIKFCSEITPNRRAYALVAIILIAELSLLLFALLPSPFYVFVLFFNGLSLGLVWGLVVGYLEGRRVSDLLLAGLSCSFIVSSAVVKDVGIALIQAGVPEFWMPFTTGLLFLPLFLATVWMLNQLPQPNQADIADRVQRAPMYAQDRYAFIRTFFTGLVTLILAYLLFTAYRDFRDSFGIEIFTQLGYAETPAIFSRTDIIVAFAVMAVMAGLNLIRNNRYGLLGAYIVMISGAALIGLGTLLFDLGMISGLWWMIVVGLGAYLAYVPYNCILFERMIASTRVIGTAVFTIYVADSVGYVGSISLMLFRDFGFSELSRLDFFRGVSYFTSICSIFLLTASCVYFMRRTRNVVIPHRAVEITDAELEPQESQA